MFLNSEDIIKLIQKLGVACDPLVKMYGPKRPLLDAQYPKLCPFFDQINHEGLAADKDASFTVHHFFKGLNLSSNELATLKEQLMAYASDNLVKINAFLDSPYLSKYETDEVSLLPLDFHHEIFLGCIILLSGDVCHNFHWKHWGDAWTLHGPLLCQPHRSFLLRVPTARWHDTEQEMNKIVSNLVFLL